METSLYQNLKLNILSLLDLSKDAIHIHIGLMALFLAVVFWKKGRIQITCMLPVMAIAVLMEALDLRDDVNSLGYMRWSASIHDLINTIFWPFIIICLAKYGCLQRRD